MRPSIHVIANTNFIAEVNILLSAKSKQGREGFSLENMKPAFKVHSICKKLCIYYA